MNNRAVLAFSGGLDTTAIVPWLIDQGFEVHAVVIDVGQNEDLSAIQAHAASLGAASVVCVDATSPLCESILPYAIALQATYEGQYRLGTAFTRPLIAMEQVRRARELGGATLVHGATGKGNDQIRFEFAYRSLAPDLPILAPWKVWSLSGRTALVDYLQSKGIAGDYSINPQYSLDENLWHLSVEGGALEDPLAVVDVAAILKTVNGRWDDSDEEMMVADDIEVEFEDGWPKAIDGEDFSLPDMIRYLNRLYRHAPWAWDLVIENRFTGIKSRGLYINPAGKLLHYAVDALARSCFNKPTYDLYTQLGRDYGAILYRGEYFSDHRLMLESAARSVMQHLTGRVRLRLSPTPHVVHLDVPQAIFTNRLATFEQSQFSHQDAQGFIQLSWLSHVGKPFKGNQDAHTMEAASSAASGVLHDQPMSAGRLVSTAA